MQAIAFTAGELPDAFLLLSAFEVKTAGVGSRCNAVVADLNFLGAITDLLPHLPIGMQAGALLINVSKLHGITHPNRARIRRLCACNHVKERGLACTVATNDPDNRTGWDLEAQVVNQ